MRNTLKPAPPTTWRIEPSLDTPQSRERLYALLRPALEHRLAVAPETSEVTCETPYGPMHLRRQGSASPGAPIRLSAASAPPTGSRGAEGKGDGLSLITLPDQDVEAAGAHLVGLEDIHASVFHQFSCRWDGMLEAWSKRTGQAIPRGIQAHFTGSPALFIFAGDPGTGKSVSAAAIADRYCRERSIPGHLVRVGTELRGNGTVGDFGNRVRAAFEQLARLPEDDLKAIVLEEAESIGMRRSEGQAHQEDRAGTATLLQCLDTFGSTRRQVVFCTTNLMESLDPALMRRAVPVTFPRPNQEARRALLTDWLPDFTPEAVIEAVVASEGMTGSDLVRALTGIFITALRENQAVAPDQIVAALRDTPQTGRV